MSLPNIFGVNLAQTINQAMGPRLLPCILSKVTEARDPNDSTRVVTTETPHSGRGFTETKTKRNREGSLIRENIEIVSILGASLPENIIPEPGDKITIENNTGIIADGGVQRDPAGALFECVVY